MKNLKSLTIIIVAALGILASVFCSNDANAYYYSPISHGHYSRAYRGYHRGYRHHTYRHYYGHRYGHRYGRRYGNRRSYRCSRCH